MPKKSRQLTIDEWKDATWQFLMEHCDITPGGSLFIKFHTSGRLDLEKRIRARAVYNYSRDDTRLNLTTEQKEQLHLKKQQEHQETKRLKKEYWRASAKERRRVLEETRRINERNLILRKYPKPIRPVINRFLDIYATARMDMIQFKRAASRVLKNTTARLPRRARATVQSD